MKITIFALHLGFGGIEKYVCTLANILSKAHDVEIISTYKTTENPAFYVNQQVRIKYLIDDLLPNKQAVHEAIYSKNLTSIIYEVGYSIKVLIKKHVANKEAMKCCKSDIIITTRDFHNRYVQKYANKNSIWISTEHNHHCNNEKYIHNLMKSIVGFDYFFPISKELCDFYSAQLIDKRTKVKYIPFCITKPKAISKLSINIPIYISVGRLSVEKGTIDLIRAFKIIKGFQNNAILHIVGNGPLYDDCVKLVRELNLEKSVIFHGFMMKEEIDELYAKSSIYLMTSYTESFGLVLLEAMANGLPCVAFDSAQGAKEIIQNGETGILLSGRDLNQFADSVVNLFDDKEKLTKMSENAKNCVYEFSYERTESDWLSFVKSITKD